MNRPSRRSSVAWAAALASAACGLAALGAWAQDSPATSSATRPVPSNLPQTRPTTLPTTGPATRPANGPATRAERDPADEVLERLLPPTTGPRQEADQDGRTLSGDRFAGAIDRSTGQGEAAVAPDTPPQRLIREGTYVINRLGRVRPRGDGEGLEFVFIADGETGPSAVDPPMVLVPNLNLMAVESAVRDEPDRRFRVTGRVTEYRGRNHLILEKVVVLR